MIDFEGKMTPYVQTAEIVLSGLCPETDPGRDVFFNAPDSKRLLILIVLFTKCYLKRFTIL